MGVIRGLHFCSITFVQDLQKDQHIVKLAVADCLTVTPMIREKRPQECQHRPLRIIYLQ